MAWNLLAHDDTTMQGLHELIKELYTPEDDLFVIHIDRKVPSKRYEDFRAQYRLCKNVLFVSDLDRVKVACSSEFARKSAPSLTRQ